MSKNYPTYQAKAKAFPAETCISVNDEVVHGIPWNPDGSKRVTSSRSIWP